MMRLALSVALLSVSWLSALAWQENTKIYTPIGNSKGPVVVFFNTATQYGLNTFPKGQWSTVDLASVGVPPDAKAVFVSGLLAITHGVNQELCDMQMTFRAPGDPINPLNFQAQVTEAHIFGGQRSNISAWVPVINGRFDIWWTSSTTVNSHPDFCAYGANLSLQAWTK